MNKQEAAKVIALTLAELGNHKAPTITEWGQANALAELFEQRGHIKPEAKVQEDEDLTVYGYCVVDRAGDFISPFEKQQDAIDYAAGQNKDCQEAGIDWDYKVAAIVDQGGL